MSVLEVRQNFDSKRSAIAKHKHCKEGNTISSAHCLQDKKKKSLVVLQKEMPLSLAGRTIGECGQEKHQSSPTTLPT